MTVSPDAQTSLTGSGRCLFLDGEWGGGQWTVDAKRALILGSLGRYGHVRHTKQLDEKVHACWLVMNHHPELRVHCQSR